MVRVDEIADIVGGRQLSSPRAAGKLRPYLRVANVLDGSIDVSNVKSMRMTDAEFTTFRLLAGDVLLNEGQSLELVGRTAVYRDGPAECAFQNSLIRLRASDGVDAEFLEYLMRYQYQSGKFARIAARTTSIAHLGVSRLAGLRVRVPDLEAQRTIAGLLGSLSAAIDCASRLHAERRVQLRELSRLTLTGRRRPPRFRASALRTMTIGDVLTKVSRPESWSDKHSYPLLSVRRRSGGIFLREHRLGALIKGKSLFRVEEGDFLISRMQVAHGALALVRGEHAGMNVSGTYDVLRSRDPKVLDIRYFDFLSRLPSMYRRIRLACHGVHIEKMTFVLGDFLKIPIMIPDSIEEQRWIVDCLEAAQREVQLLEELLVQYRAQRRALMDRLLSGPTP